MEIKCLVLGDDSVGKTSLVMRFSSNNPPPTMPTVLDNQKVMIMHKNEPVELSIWDTAGGEEFDRLRPLSYPGTDIILLCFSIHEASSFDHLSSRWIPEIENLCPNTPILLIGTKGDVRSPQSISTDKIAAKQKEIGAMMYIETSSVTGINVSSAFTEAIKACPRTPKLERRTKIEPLDVAKILKESAHEDPEFIATLEAIRELSFEEPAARSTLKSKTPVTIDAVINPIIKLLSSKNHLVQIEATKILGNLSKDNPSIQDRIVKDNGVEGIIAVWRLSNQAKDRVVCADALRNLIQYEDSHEQFADSNGWDIFLESYPKDMLSMIKAYHEYEVMRSSLIEKNFFAKVAAIANGNKSEDVRIQEEACDLLINLCKSDLAEEIVSKDILGILNNTGSKNVQITKLKIISLMAKGDDVPDEVVDYMFKYADVVVAALPSRKSLKIIKIFTREEERSRILSDKPGFIEDLVKILTLSENIVTVAHCIDVVDPMLGFAYSRAKFLEAGIIKRYVDVIQARRPPYTLALSAVNIITSLIEHLNDREATKYMGEFISSGGVNALLASLKIDVQMPPRRDDHSDSDDDVPTEEGKLLDLQYSSTYLLRQISSRESLRPLLKEHVGEINKLEVKNKEVQQMVNEVRNFFI